jgi:DNA-binding transcriptional MerR regulator
MSDARFTDGKAADALRTIGEVASALNIRQHVLRYWEDQFPMLKPLKRSGGRRYYRAEDVALVERIDRLVHREGYTLRGARLALEGKGCAAPVAPAAAVAPMPEDTGFAMRARLVALRHTLATALQDS